ncbi:MAG: protein phosphatase 2C domain-containing protein, partial [Myxococcota bacterium]|nr:protein phosphatase 2C domain-containing protein [Myxococcota bacterium]
MGLRGAFVQVEAWARTDVGLKRHHNEDACLVDGEKGLFVVADGMGGHNAGEVASAILVDTVASRIAEF